MGLFEHFPYVNFHELNIDWILRKLKQVEDDIRDLWVHMDEAEQRLDGHDEEIAAIKLRLDEDEEFIADLRERMSSAELAIDDLDDRLDMAELYITQLQERIALLGKHEPVYIMYDAVDIPDPADYVTAIEEDKKPVYLRKTVGASYEDYPLAAYSRSTTGNHDITLTFFDNDAELAGAILGIGNAIGPAAILLQRSDILPATFTANLTTVPYIGSNNNKFLKVNNTGTAIEWANVPAELPATTGNAGKVLSVNALGTGVEWANVAGGDLPAISSGDAGKALVVNNSEDGVEWATVSGGGGLPPYSASDIGHVLAVNSDASDVEWVDVDTSSIDGTGSVTWLYTDYSSSDLNTIDAIAADGNWTAAELRKYDFDLDGRITAADKLILQAMLTNQQDRTVNVRTVVDPADGDNPVMIYDENNDALGWLAPNEYKAPSGRFNHLSVGGSYIDESGKLVTVDNVGGEAMASEPADGIRFYDSNDVQTAVYPADASTFLRDNGLSVNKMAGSGYDAYNAAGTYTYPMSSDHTYLVTYMRRNTPGSSDDGLWLVDTNSGTSHVTTIKSSAACNVSVSGLTMTVTTTNTYGRMTFTRLA